MKISIIVIITLVACIILTVRKNKGLANKELIKTAEVTDELCLSDSVYLVDAIELPWGLTLKDARVRLKNKQILRTYGGQRNLRVQCENAFGFLVSEVCLTAPREDVPVMQVSYELLPADPNATTVNPEYWVSAISKSLGPPLKNPKPRKYKVEPSKSGSVIYNTSWVTGNVRVTLSTYGGYRKNEQGAIAIAGLFIDWENEIQFAKPYLAKVEEIEKSLADVNAEKYVSDMIFTQTAQKPYYIPDYHLPDPHTAAKNRELRRAQRVLMSQSLFDTPEALANIMNERAVLIWQQEGQRDFVFSTKWDSVHFYSDSDKNSVSWSNTLPAKGAGGMTLGINGLGVSDYHSSEQITKLANRISMCQNQKIECFKDYDC